MSQRRAILDGLIAAHRGRIANSAGDSVLAEFGSAVDAVQCAVEVQAALAGTNTDLEADRHIKFRIGIHVGDVMIKGGDLFGDGVNIAARLQTLASAGGVCISGAAHCAEAATRFAISHFSAAGATADHPQTGERTIHLEATARPKILPAKQ
jgi:adenylate cyclase